VRALPLALLLGCAAPPAASFESPSGLRFVLIPAGEFLMGSSPEEARRQADAMAAKKIGSWYPDSPRSEAPPRLTRITRPFYLATTETTLGAFRRFVDASGYRTEAERDGKGADGKRDGRWTTGKEFTWRDMGYERGDDFPVTNVTHADAVAFCEWLSKAEGRRYRLPTEAEWEHACRAGSAGRYPWGDDDALRNEHAWTGANSGGGPHPVGRRKPNAWGLHDMLGNVYEYCSDWFVVAPYDAAQSVDPKGPPTGTQFVVRSASWGTDPMHARCAFRGGAPPGHRNMRDGFRVAADP
jgi:formylglycine-generating enzyme required for sulfatase activity